MAQALPGSTYTVQPGDLLFSIHSKPTAMATSGRKIYDVNKEVIGMILLYLSPGEVLLFIPPLQPKTCTVTAANGSECQSWRLPANQHHCQRIILAPVLNYIEVVNGK